jgi:hypothetical protein
MTQTITAETREKLTKIINAGLVRGLGKARPGRLSIEAAICLALGEPHSDRPSCVAQPDRLFAISINDAPWSSPWVRAEALLPLALAQLGTAGTDRTAWDRRVTEGTIRQIVPIALRAASSVHPDERHRAAMETAAVRCGREGTRGAANAAWVAATDAATTYTARACRACIYTYTAAGDAADAAAEAVYADRDDVLRIAVQIALDAYAAEGRA